MSDRIIKISEISEPNSPTLLGPSNQKSKLTSGGRLAAHSHPSQATHIGHFRLFSYLPSRLAGNGSEGVKFFSETLVGTRSRVNARDALAKCTQNGVAISQFGFPFAPHVVRFGTPPKRERAP